MEKLKSLLYSLAAFVVLVVLARLITLNISLVVLSAVFLYLVYLIDKKDKLSEDDITILCRIVALFAGWAMVANFKAFFEIVKGVQGDVFFSGLGYLVLIFLSMAFLLFGGAIYLFQKSKETKFGYLLISLFVGWIFYWLLAYGYNVLMYGYQWYDWMLK